MSKTALPEYSKPPVSEVALSISFAPLEKWKSAHAGMYWSKINDRYPLTEVHAPIANQIEKLEEELKPPKAMTLQIELQNPDSQRYWFLSDPSTKLVQIQRDRFVINWRKVKGDEEYPRYQNELRPRLAEEWETLIRFLQDNKIGVPDVQQCEVLYTNDILRDDDWSTFEEALTIFSSFWAKGSIGFLPNPEALTVRGSFRMPDQSGRLHFVAQRVFRNIDGREAIQLQLVARGKPKSSSTQDILSWMDLGREWIVHGFTDLTSNRAHRIWERTQ